MALSGASELTSSAMNIINIVSKPNARRRNQLFSEVESHQGYLRRFAMALMRGAAQVEEVVQEVLLADFMGSLIFSDGWLRAMLKVLLQKVLVLKVLAAILRRT